MQIYYAHPMTWYGTPQETEAITSIYKRWSDATVINPGTPYWEDRARRAKDNGGTGMEPFLEAIREEADILVFSAFSDLAIGSGVAKEIVEAVLDGKTVFELDAHGAHVYRYPLSAFGHRFLTVAETKRRTVAGIK